MNDINIISSCRVCQGKNLVPFFDLGKQPLANSLLSLPNEPEAFYSLSLSWCGDCSLVQLNETVAPEILFSNYVWVTGTSRTARGFAQKFCEELLLRAKDTRGYILELASNDGTFLRPFLNRGYEVLGIDPAKNIAEMAEAAGIPTKPLFWGKQTAEELLRSRGQAQIIFARNVLPHVANTLDFIEGIALCLRDDGIAAIEVHYAKTILEELHYDSVYHEHLCYFTLKSLERLLHVFNLFVFDVAMSPISGGSIVVYIKKGPVAESQAVKNLRDKEVQDRTNEFRSWQNFSRRAFDHKAKLLEILSQAGKSGVVVGWGASARSSTLLNFCGIDAELVSAVADLNPLKQGKFTAGTHIPIVSPREVLALGPKTVFIMAWNFADEIIDILKREYNYKGQCLIPLPGEPRMVTVS